jgi:hypothetical protein
MASHYDPDDENREDVPTKRGIGTLSEITLHVQLQAHLGWTLKAVYQTVVKESVPERLLKLLHQLDRQEKKSSRAQQEE